MKISELIEELQSHLEEFGDLDTHCFDEYGFVSLITGVYYSVIRYDEHGNPMQVGIVIDN